MTKAESSGEKVARKPLLLNEVRAEKLRLTMNRLADITVQILRNPMGLMGVVILAVFTLLAAFGPMIAPYDTSNLGLGKWQQPSTFATDPPSEAPFLVPILTLVAGAVCAAMALTAAFARRHEWMKGNKPFTNKLLQMAALSVAAVTVVLLVLLYFVNPDAITPMPVAVYPLSVAIASLTMLSLATRRRVSKRRLRLRVAGIVLSIVPVVVMSAPLVIDIGDDIMDAYFLVGYGASGFLIAIAGALLSRAYEKPPAALLELEANKNRRSRFTRISVLAKGTGVLLCVVLILSGVLGYQSENWTTHWMGTDSFGAYIFSELLYGARTSMIVGVFSAVIASVLGALVGLYSGYVGGRVDEVIMRANDVVLSIPWLVLMIIVAAMMEEINLEGIILIIGLTGWSPTARMVRAQVLSIRERQYIERARAIGSSDLGIIRRHVLPNSFPLVFANTILTVAVSILSEATLSFLGMRPVGTVTWGTMLDYASSAGAITIGLHWWIIAPGMCIVIVVLGFTLLGYALDDILNPKLRKR